VGLQILKRVRQRAVLTDKPLSFNAERPQRRHVVGALLFGIGWGVANVCPGPILAQLGEGIGWGVITFVGAAGGVYFFLRRGAKETEPAADPGPSDAADRAPTVAGAPAPG
jgi:uncharacterized membrane protein YedE/YeeE